MTQTKQRLTFEEYLTYDDGSDRVLSPTVPDLSLVDIFAFSICHELP